MLSLFVVVAEQIKALRTHRLTTLYKNALDSTLIIHKALSDSTRAETEARLATENRVMLEQIVDRYSMIGGLAMAN